VTDIYDRAITNVEGLDLDRYIIATYLIQASSEDDHLHRAVSAAMEQTVGRGSYLAEDLADHVNEFGGKLISVFRIPDHLSKTSLTDLTRVTTVARVAYPAINTGMQIPMLLTMVLGDLSFSGMIKLIDLDLPATFTNAFQGPKYGFDGIRDRLADDRPLICSILKPCVGLDAKAAAEIFYQHALGGADVIKDDELMAYTEAIPIEDRVAACSEMTKKVFEETGHKVIYLASVTDRPDRMQQKAHRAIEAGATGLMLTPLTTGIAALQMLAEDPAIEVPLFAHPALLGATSWSPDFGVSAHIYAAKLFRLAGADINATQVPYGRFPHLRESYIRTLKQSKAPMAAIKPVFTQVGGGLGASKVAEVMKDVGNDVMLVLGSSVQRHPMGLTAGVKAVRQAIQAEMDGQTAAEAASKYPELEAALTIP
jgi:2,3-diketo-5-methylthiopentyl-1-phosphate enolase